MRSILADLRIWNCIEREKLFERDTKKHRHNRESKKKKREKKILTNLKKKFFFVAATFWILDFVVVCFHFQMQKKNQPKKNFFVLDPTID